MDDVKARTLKVAAEILEREGVQAVSTRSVAAAAGIRAASLYQLFGDKDALLAALAIYAYDKYLGEKRSLAHTEDPVDDLRRGWDAHVDFGLRHPAFYLLMFGPDRPGRRPPAADEAQSRLLGAFSRVAAAGRLRVPVPLAAQLSSAACVGVTLALIASPPPNPAASPSPNPVASSSPDPVAALMRDIVIGSLITDAPSAPADSGLASRALALDAALDTAPSVPLRPAEVALLRDWLNQIALS